MKNKIYFVLFILSLNAQASIIGIMDSGTDISHMDLKNKLYTNGIEKLGNLDLDHDGLAGDVYGWDFTKNVASPFDDKYNYLITDEVKKFYAYYAKYETRTISQSELTWIKENEKNEELMNVVDFIGGLIHGTHVSGISVKNSPSAKLISYKILPTEFDDPKQISFDEDEYKKKGKLSIVTPERFNELKSNILIQAQEQVAEMSKFNELVNMKKMDVVNQSFGVGQYDAEVFIKSDFLEKFNREPNKNELKILVDAYFKKLLSEGKRMYQIAPDTIFVVAAGNDANNIDIINDYPSNIEAENKVVVAATLEYSELAEFSNYGKTKVDVAAPGVAINSTAPMDNYIQLSGTSQAAPFVTNTIAQIKDANPKLTLPEIKEILFKTVDFKSWLKDIVRTGGIVNRERAIFAAKLTINNSIEKSISDSRFAVSDVVEVVIPDNEQSFIGPLNFRPKRASLLIKKHSIP